MESEAGTKKTESLRGRPFCRAAIFHARAAAAHDGDLLGRLGLRELLGIEVLKARAAVDGALRMAALDEFVDAALLTADAGPDLRNLARVGLVAPVLVGQQRTAQHGLLLYVPAV